MQRARPFVVGAMALAALAACGSSSESAAHYAGRATAASTDIVAQLSSLQGAAGTTDRTARTCREARPKVEADLKVLDEAPDAQLKARATTFGAQMLQLLDDCSAKDAAALARDVPKLRQDLDAVNARLDTLSGS